MTSHLSVEKSHVICVRKKFARGQRVKICPDVAPGENKDLKMKVRQIPKDSYADTSNRLTYPDMLAYHDLSTFVLKMVVARILAVWVLYHYKVAVVPVFHAGAACI
jgi:hypothetical protein